MMKYMEGRPTPNITPAILVNDKKRAVVLNSVDDSDILPNSSITTVVLVVALANR
jgi:hypothetical protein